MLTAIIKEGIKAKLKTQTDAVFNDLVMTLKGSVNRATDNFLDQLWPAVESEVIKAYVASEKEKAAKKATEEAKKKEEEKEPEVKADDGPIAGFHS